MSYEATHWERGQVLGFFRLLLSNCLNWKNLLRWSFFTFNVLGYQLQVFVMVSCPDGIEVNVELDCRLLWTPNWYPFVCQFWQERWSFRLPPIERGKPFYALITLEILHPVSKCFAWGTLILLWWLNC